MTPNTAGEPTPGTEREAFDTLAIAMRSDALEVFDGHECSQDVRDAIEHCYDFLRAALAKDVLEGGSLDDIDALLAQYHAEVWEAAAGETIDYDMAGVETAKQLRTAIAALVGKEASRS